MEQYVKSVSRRAEFTIVVLVAFGYATLGSALSLLAPSSSAPIYESGLQFMLFYEVVVLVALGGFLSVRGWNLQQLGFVPTVKDTGLGVGFAVIAYVVHAAVWVVSSAFVPGLGEKAGHLVSPGLSLITVLAVSALNPIFEEVFVCGYVITALKKTRSISFAVNVSIGIRLAYHLYQGAVGVISIIPLGFIFAYWFAKTGRLWPLVIAHGIFDLLGLVFYARL